MNDLFTSAYQRLRDQVERLDQRTISRAAPAIHFARALLGTSYALLDCDTCQAALPEYIEAELNNQRSPDYRQVRRHVDLCPACSDVYLDLLEVALLAEEGLLPGPSLPIDLSFLKPSSGRSVCDA